jgi:LysM repeat protein
MKKRTSVFARIFAALALVAAIVAVVVLVSSALKDDNSPHKRHQSGTTTTHESTKHRTKAKTYTVQTGDTLIAIAHQTGVPVSELLALNPEVDPQILIAGETLKLR